MTTTPDYDRIKLGLVSFIRRTLGAWIVNNVDYLAAYQCKVVSQNGDGTLELQPDDSRLPPFSRVPIRYGVPGVAALVSPGSRVLLEFASANPQKPIATVWETASVTRLTVTATDVKVNATTAEVTASGQLTVAGSPIVLTGGGVTGSMPVARTGDQVIGTAGPYPIVATIGPGNPSVVA